MLRIVSSIRDILNSGELFKTFAEYGFGVFTNYTSNGREYVKDLNDLYQHSAIIYIADQSPHLTIIAQDVEIADRAAEYVHRIIEGLGLAGKDWYLDLFSSRPIGTWCAEGKDRENILRLE